MKLFKRTEASVAGCNEYVCRPHMRHAPCVDCGDLTTARTIRIEPKTLRRTKPFVCDRCAPNPGAAQERLRRERTERDMAQLTDPVDASRLRVGELPEQYAGATRATIRAFVESGETKAVVLGISVGTLNQSINALGLTRDIYAEQRDDLTVLRRVA